MVFINSIDENIKEENFLILVSEDTFFLVVNKYDEPVVVNINDLDTFVQKFLIKEELIDWLCSHMEELLKYPELLKDILTKISIPKDIIRYVYFDKTARTELKGGKHKIEIWQDEFGSCIKVSDKRNRTLVKVSLYDTKILTTTVRNDNDKTKFVVLYPKTKEKIQVSTDDIHHWRGRYGKAKKNKG